jgi:hypothetical protein
MKRHRDLRRVFPPSETGRNNYTDFFGRPPEGSLPVARRLVVVAW